MNNIENVLICGLGALGVTYGSKLKDICNLKILVNEKRLNKFKSTPPMLNDEIINFEYILEDDEFSPDLIIISTKYNGLKSAIANIKNFVKKDTIIISLLNGISAEEEISKVYGKEKVIHSYFIGHSAMREGTKVYQDGYGKIVIGSVYNNKDKLEILEEFLSENNLEYDVSKDIVYSMWVKLGVNICLNQFSAIKNMTVGELRKDKDYINLSPKLAKEAYEVAKANNIPLKDSYINDVNNEILQVADNGKTSMLQDIRFKRPTEVDLFAGKIIELGKNKNINTSYNQCIYKKIKEIENSYL